MIILMLDNRLGMAPPNNPGANVKRVLDVGTGTGIWAIDYADEHPDTQVVGVDLSPIQPDLYLFLPFEITWITTNGCKCSSKCRVLHR